MGSRSKARKRALDMLFAADVRQTPLAEIVNAEAQRASSEPQRESSWLYAREIVDGVIDHGDRIDQLIQAHAEGWSLERMPAVDRAILRIAVWELLFNDQVPSAVAIDEAVEAAKTMSTDDSPNFVNGVLGAVAKASS